MLTLEGAFRRRRQDLRLVDVTLPELLELGALDGARPGAAADALVPASSVEACVEKLADRVPGVPAQGAKSLRPRTEEALELCTPAEGRSAA